MLLKNHSDRELVLCSGSVPYSFPPGTEIVRTADENGTLTEVETDVVVEIGNLNAASHFIGLTMTPPKRMGIGERAAYQLQEYKPGIRRYRVAKSILPAHAPQTPPPEGRINWVTRPEDYKAPEPNETKKARERAERLATLPHKILLAEAVNRKLAKPKTCPSIPQLVDMLMPTDYQPPVISVSADNPLTAAVAKEKGLVLPSAEKFAAEIDKA